MPKSFRFSPTSYLAAAVLALGAGATLSLPAHAAPSMRANLVVNALFGNLDLNGDGKIDAAEMRAAREQRFARLDTNHDGTISQAELKQANDRIQRRAVTAENIMASRFENLDTNGDGVVSKAEFLDAKTALPLIVDIDGDGTISKEEVLRIVSALPAFQ
jgi:Ca2+-binding EF-hand superfamily protein